jgi:hypothetical protein
MLRVVQRAGEFREITIGPSAGTTIVRVLLVLAGFGLLIKGVVAWPELIHTLRFLHW